MLSQQIKKLAENATPANPEGIAALKVLMRECYKDGHVFLPRQIQSIPDLKPAQKHVLAFLFIHSDNSDEITMNGKQFCKNFPSVNVTTKTLYSYLAKFKQLGLLDYSERNIRLFSHEIFSGANFTLPYRTVHTVNKNKIQEEISPQGEAHAVHDKQLKFEQNTGKPVATAEAKPAVKSGEKSTMGGVKTIPEQLALIPEADRADVLKAFEEQSAKQDIRYPAKYFAAIVKKYHEGRLNDLVDGKSDVAQQLCEARKLLKDNPPAITAPVPVRQTPSEPLSDDFEADMVQCEASLGLTQPEAISGTDSRLAALPNTLKGITLYVHDDIAEVVLTSAVFMNPMKQNIGVIQAAFPDKRVAVRVGQ